MRPFTDLDHSFKSKEIWVKETCFLSGTGLEGGRGERAKEAAEYLPIQKGSNPPQMHLKEGRQGTI